MTEVKKMLGNIFTIISYLVDILLFDKCKLKWKLISILSVIKLYFILFIRKYITGNTFQENKITAFGYTFYGCNIGCILDIFVNKPYLLKIKKKKLIIFDIGGNTGIATLFFKKFYPNSKIYVFEPNPYAYKQLVLNIRKNNIKNVYAYNVGVGENTGRNKMILESPIDLGARVINNDKLHRGKSSIEITLIKLSDFIQEEKIEKIDLLKIDVEGYEGRIIKDLDKHNLLPRVKNIVLEYHWTEDKKNRLSDILKILENNNFYYIVTNFTSHTEDWCKFLAYVYASRDIKILQNLHKNE